MKRGALREPVRAGRESSIARCIPLNYYDEENYYGYAGSSQMTVLPAASRNALYPGFRSGFILQPPRIHLPFDRIRDLIFPASDRMCRLKIEPSPGWCREADLQPGASALVELSCIARPA